MKIKLLSGFSVLLLAGCAGNPMTEAEYREVGNYANNLQKCSENGYIDHRTYAEARSALGYALSKKSYSSDKLTKMANASLSRTYVNASSCRETKVYTYRLLSKVSQLKGDQQAIARATRELNSLASSLNNTSRKMMDSANSINNQSYNYNTNPYGSDSNDTGSNKGSTGIYKYYNKNGNTITGSNGESCFVVDKIVNCQ